MPTPHIAAQKGDIAATVLMPGDPLRAKYIAERYLTDVQTFNTIRNMLGFTGLYQGEKVSVMGSGMGMPSIGIYSYELFHEYDVETIIRVGSCGAFQDDIHVMDIVIGQAACTNSSYAAQFNTPGFIAPIASFDLLQRAADLAKERKLRCHVGNILSSDTFYNDDPTFNDRWRRLGVLAVEMEAAALYLNAMRAGKKALCLLTVSDHLYRDEALSAEERQTSFHQMMELALDL